MTRTLLNASTSNDTILLGTSRIQKNTIALEYTRFVKLNGAKCKALTILGKFCQKFNIKSRHISLFSVSEYTEIDVGWDSPQTPNWESGSGTDIVSPESQTPSWFQGAASQQDRDVGRRGEKD